MLVIRNCPICGNILRNRNNYIDSFNSKFMVKRCIKCKLDFNCGNKYYKDKRIFLMEMESVRNKKEV